MTTISDYRHPGHDFSQTPDERPGAYYVSVIDRETGRAFLATGPYPDHRAALAAVEPVRRRAQELTGRSTERARRLTTWGAFGTCRMDLSPTNPRGPMNHLMPRGLNPEDR